MDVQAGLHLCYSQTPEDMFSRVVPICILMEFSIHIDTIKMGLPILYLKGSQVEVSVVLCISITDGCFSPRKQCGFY